jgi:hypothetical protein
MVRSAPGRTIRRGTGVVSSPAAGHPPLPGAVWAGLHAGRGGAPRGRSPDRINPNAQPNGLCPDQHGDTWLHDSSGRTSRASAATGTDPRVNAGSAFRHEIRGFRLSCGHQSRANSPGSFQGKFTRPSRGPGAPSPIAPPHPFRGRRERGRGASAPWRSRAGSRAVPLCSRCPQKSHPH